MTRAAAVRQHAASVRCFQARGDIQQRRLARPEKSDQLAFLDILAEVVDNVKPKKALL